jgi:hypothetical protein
LSGGRKRARSSDDEDDKKSEKKSKKNADPQDEEGSLTTDRDLTLLDPEEKLREIPLAEFQKYLIEDVAQLCLEYLGSLPFC